MTVLQKEAELGAELIITRSYVLKKHPDQQATQRS